jgi:long-chain fatty acid transport protein
MRIRVLASIAASLALTSSPVLGTNGYWSHGYGPKSKSVAGACVALPLEGMCNAINPAGAVHLGSGYEVGLSIFAPDHGFHANDDWIPPDPALGGPAHIDAGTYASGKDFFFVPNFNYTHMLDESSSISLTIGGNGGMNTDYDGAIFKNFANPMIPSTQASNPTGIDLMQGFVGVNYAYKVNEKHSLGVMPFLAVQSFEARGLEPFTPFSKHPDKVTNNGREISYGVGLRIGWMGRVTDKLTLGASYQTRSYMREFDKYAGLFAEDGGFDIPPNFDLGLAYDLTPTLTLAFGYQRIDYSSVRALANESDLPFVPGEILLGCDDCMGFGWEDVSVYRFAAQWAYREDLILRAGFSIASDAFPNSQALLNVLAPAVVREHLTFGVTRKLDKTNEIDFAITYAPEVKLDGTNVNTGPQTGYLYMDQWDLALGWVRHF